MIEDLLGEGQVDSTGRFTLDAQRAAEKLARYRLHNPQAYILHLAASGVAAGASRLDFRHDKTGLQFAHDGQQPDFAQLGQILEVLAHSPPPPAWQRELAIALQALRNVVSSGVTFDCSGGRLELGRHQLTVSPVAAPYCLSVRSGFVRGRLLQLLKVDVPELRLLAEHFLYCPIPVETPQGPINRLWPHAGRAWSARHTPWPLQRHSLNAREESSWGWAAALAKVDSAKNLELVVHGRSYAQREEGLSGTALVYSDTLTTDLSGDQVIKNQLYEEMLQAISRTH